MYWWANEYPVTQMACEAKIGEVICISGSKKFVQQHFLQTQIILGRPGIIVQVDESQFLHKPKVEFC